jgi:hypothetical protein
MAIWWVIEAAAISFLFAWSAFAIFGIWVLVHMANSVKGDMEVYDRAWRTDREIQK